MEYLMMAVAGAGVLVFMLCGPVVVLFVAQLCGQQGVATPSQVLFGVALGLISWCGGSFNIMTEWAHLNAIFSGVVIAVWIIGSIVFYYRKFMS